MNCNFPIANGLDHWTQDLDRAIINYLAHTGSLACVCKTSKSTCLAQNAGRQCCETQQFYHPNGAVLLSTNSWGKSYINSESIQVQDRIILVKRGRMIIDSEDDDDGEDVDDDDEGSDWHGLTASQFEDKVIRNNWTWLCCTKGFYCTGCLAVTDATDVNDTDAAIRSNKDARKEEVKLYNFYQDSIKMIVR
uniref:Uncharacterized protein n=1 Tax=Proboscia inermis TaxID=420281 RepID=A0A7S0GFX5_9STRA|mmetsp:Transcript_32372/g.32668  ORF Transcript_32372/g.32668 Transcript_32372/m.32668 type:complete len:192 (+) Transcript_32372:63-638(+)|eukprot:CAMPEP_0171327182 /NCGR_PEP_ID=MMETSP0816-20121228/117918_1 /TAXON_ID=420281 /ORGANISM="Proboscia inermis, Strain CCAP1064/1" /LENGTH=191 /DNA_ID=CAMNT_0011826831 /DNA_START=23 /DNA_END=598 /DNA_ORIENTATION=+